MDQRNQETIDWYEDEQGPDAGHPGSLPGLPLSWPGLLWCLASAAFALVWIGESIGSLDPSRGFVTYSVFAGHIWVLLLVLAICTLIRRVARPLKGLAYVLSGSAAVCILLTHTF
ncbi:MAG: hypothetical protein ABWY78_21490 [Microvirga sp.]